MGGSAYSDENQVKDDVQETETTEATEASTPVAPTESPAAPVSASGETNG